MGRNRWEVGGERSESGGNIKGFGRSAGADGKNQHFQTQEVGGTTGRTHRPDNLVVARRAEGGGPPKQDGGPCESARLGPPWPRGVPRPPPRPRTGSLTMSGRRPRRFLQVPPTHQTGNRKPAFKSHSVCPAKGSPQSIAKARKASACRRLGACSLPIPALSRDTLWSVCR